MCPLETISIEPGFPQYLDIFIGQIMEGSSLVPVDSVPTHVSYNTMVTEWENFQNWAILPVNSQEAFSDTIWIY